MRCPMMRNSVVMNPGKTGDALVDSGGVGKALAKGSELRLGPYWVQHSLYLSPLLLVEHWDISLATPAPEHLHAATICQPILAAPRLTVYSLPELRTQRSGGGRR